MTSKHTLPLLLISYTDHQTAASLQLINVRMKDLVHETYTRRLVREVLG